MDNAAKGSKTFIDPAIVELCRLNADATIGHWRVVESDPCADGSIYIDADDNGDRPVAMIMSGSPHNQDRADAAFAVAAVAYVRKLIERLPA